MSSTNNSPIKTNANKTFKIICCISSIALIYFVLVLAISIWLGAGTHWYQSQKEVWQFIYDNNSAYASLIWTRVGLSITSLIICTLGYIYCLPGICKTMLGAKGNKNSIANVLSLLTILLIITTIVFLSLSIASAYSCVESIEGEVIESSWEAVGWIAAVLPFTIVLTTGLTAKFAK